MCYNNTKFLSDGEKPGEKGENRSWSFYVNILEVYELLKEDVIITESKFVRPVATDYN